MKPQVAPDHYFNKDYDSKGRFIGYWHQVNETMTLEPHSILEIGIGNGFVANYLKKRGFNVTTVDIDERLNPDKVGSVLSLPFPSESFEVVTCFEVLEHLPYENFPKALSEIYRVSSKYAVLSLPDSSRVYRVNIQIPKIGELKRLIPLPRWKPPKHELDGKHYWEIGEAGHPLRRIFDNLDRAGFRVINSYRLFEMPYYRFFVLAKGEVGVNGWAKK